MTLQQHIEFTAEQCKIAAEVGTTIFADCFYDALRAFAKNILVDEDVPKEQDSK